MRELDPGPDQIVGPKQLGEMFGRGVKWARTLLREWHEEQKKGGPVRVLPRRGRGGIITLYTTKAVLAAHAPPARDMVLVRAVREIDKDLTALARRLDALTDTVRELGSRRR